MFFAGLFWTIKILVNIVKQEVTHILIVICCPLINKYIIPEFIGEYIALCHEISRFNLARGLFF